MARTKVELLSYPLLSCVPIFFLLVTHPKNFLPHCSKPRVSPQEVKLQESNWRPRLPESPLQLLVVSKSLTDTDLVPSLFVRSEDTKSLLSSWSESFHSSYLSEKSPKTSRLTWDSRDLPSWLFRRPPRPTLLVFSRIPTWPPSTPRESPSCLRTSNLPAESVASALKHLNHWIIFHWMVDWYRNQTQTNKQMVFLKTTILFGWELYQIQIHQLLLLLLNNNNNHWFYSSCSCRSCIVCCVQLYKKLQLQLCWIAELLIMISHYKL